MLELPYFRLIFTHNRGQVTWAMEMDRHATEEEKEVIKEFTHLELAPLLDVGMREILYARTQREEAIKAAYMIDMEIMEYFKREEEI